MKNTQRGFGTLLAAVVLAAVVGFGAYAYIKQTAVPATDNSGGVACTMEAKQCPDGSYVGRQGPNCEFAACPVVPAPVSSVPADWKTYASTQYGFEFKYPGNGVVTEGDSELGGFHGLSIGLGQQGGVASAVTFRIYPSTLPAERSVDYIKGERRASSVAGIPALEVVPSEQSYAFDEKGNKRVWFAFSQNGYAYVLSTTGPTAEVARQILSTFRFTK